MSATVQKQEAAVTVADRAKLFASRLGDEEESGEESTPKQSKLGATVRALTPEMADRLNVPSGKGVVVQEVKPGSFADDIGLSRGDVVIEINKQPVNSEDDFEPHPNWSEERPRCRVPGTAAWWREQQRHHLSRRNTSVTIT